MLAPQTTAIKILRELLYLRAYKMEIVQAVKATDGPTRAELTVLDNDDLHLVCFTD